MVRASQFCVAPAGQSKLRSGGLREGSLTLACLRMCPLPQGSRIKAVDEALCGVSCLSGFVLVGPGSSRRISMSLRGCLCRLPQHRLLTRSRMPSRLCLRWCSCLLALLVVGHCGLSLSGLFEVRNCRLWPMLRTSSCRRRFRRQRRSRRCSG